MSGQIFCADDTAEEAASAKVLADSGITPSQVSIIARLREKSEYVFRSIAVWRKFRLGLSPMEIALAGSNKPEQLAEMDRILSRYGREEFAYRWALHCGLDCPELRPVEMMAAE